jgi:hypothetical protein
MADLPNECGPVLSSGGNKPPANPMLVQDTSKDAAPPPKAVAETPPAPAVSKASVNSQATKSAKQ